MSRSAVRRSASADQPHCISMLC